MNAESNTIWDALTKMNAGDLPLVITLSLLFLALLIFVVSLIAAKTIFSVHKTRVEADLKRELVSQGFSPDEITRIVEASAKPQATRPSKHSATPEGPGSFAPINFD